MEPRILNFVEAMEMKKLFASSNITQVDLSSDGISLLLKSIHPQVFLQILKLLTGRESKEMDKLNGDEALSILVSGLYINKINYLLSIANNKELYDVI